MRSSTRMIQVAASNWVARRDAGLSAVEGIELQAWLEADPRHRAALAHCDSAWGALDRPYRSGAANNLLIAVNSRIQRGRRHQLTSVAAALAVLLTAGFIWRSTQTGSPEPTSLALAAAPVVVVPSYQLLPDGSQVELNGGARIKTEFDARLRRVVLQEGEAHFHVTKDTTRPFVVAVGSVEVRAVGTAFSVQRNQAKVEIVVTQGEVAVDKYWEISRDAGGSTGGEAIFPPQTIATLAVNHRAVVGISAADRAPPDVEVLAIEQVSERLAWRAPRLEFSGTPLSEAVALLNAHADKAVVAGQPAPRYTIGDPEIAAMRVSGLFRVDNTESFVRLLQHGFGIEAEAREGSSDIVLRKSRSQ